MNLRFMSKYMGCAFASYILASRCLFFINNTWHMITWFFWISSIGRSTPLLNEFRDGVEGGNNGFPFLDLEVDFPFASKLFDSLILKITIHHFFFRNDAFGWISSHEISSFLLSSSNSSRLISGTSLFSTNLLSCSTCVAFSKLYLLRIFVKNSL